MADHVDTLAISGNQWDNRGFTVAPVNVNGTNVAVAGNMPGNDGRVVATLDAPTTLTATSGDHVYFLSDGAGITLPDAAGNTCRITGEEHQSGGLQGSRPAQGSRSTGTRRSPWHRARPPRCSPTAPTGTASRTE